LYEGRYYKDLCIVQQYFSYFQSASLLLVVIKISKLI